MPKRNLYTGSLSTIILSLLGEKGKMYGYQITREVEKLTRRELVLNEGALYPVLHKLEAKGLICVEMEKVNNRTRKYYSITENGKKETATLLEDLKAFINTMNIILDIKPANYEPKCNTFTDR